MKKEDLQKEMVQKITAQEFLMEKNKLNVAMPVIIIFSVLILFSATVLLTGSFILDGFIAMVSFIAFVGAILFYLLNIETFDNKSNIKKGNYSHRIEVCEKVLRKGSNWVVETDHGYLFEFNEEVCVGDEILTVVIGKSLRTAYLLAENKITYELITDDEK